MRGPVPVDRPSRPGGDRQGQRRQGGRHQRRDQRRASRPGLCDRRRLAPRGTGAGAGGAPVHRGSDDGGGGRHHPHRQRVHGGCRACRGGAAARRLAGAVPGGGVSPRLPQRTRRDVGDELPADRVRRLRDVPARRRDRSRRFPHRHGRRGHGDRRPFPPPDAPAGEALPDCLPARSGVLDRGPRVAGDPRQPAEPLAARGPAGADDARADDRQRALRRGGAVRDAVLRDPRGREPDRRDCRLRPERRGPGVRADGRGVRAALLPGGDRLRRADLGFLGAARGDRVPALSPDPRSGDAGWYRRARELRLPAADDVVAAEGDVGLRPRPAGVGTDGAEGVCGPGKWTSSSDLAEVTRRRHDGDHGAGSRAGP